jgi:hypothetical protein
MNEEPALLFSRFNEGRLLFSTARQFVGLAVAQPPLGGEHYFAAPFFGGLRVRLRLTPAQAAEAQRTL